MSEDGYYSDEGGGGGFENPGYDAYSDKGYGGGGEAITSGYGPGMGSFGAGSNYANSNQLDTSYDMGNGLSNVSGVYTATGGGSEPAAAIDDSWWKNVSAPPNRESGGIYSGTPDTPNPKITNNTGTYSGGRGSSSGSSLGQTFADPGTFKPKLLAAPIPFTPVKYTPGEFKTTAALDLPEFKPPEEDKNFQNVKREQYAASGKRALGKQVNAALLSSRNMDNPTARAQVLKSVVEGYGGGLGSVMGEAGNAARQDAQAKRSEELQTYAANWSANSEEARTKYKQDFDVALQNFMLGEQANQANVNSQNQAGLFNLQNSQAIASQNVAMENDAAKAKWSLNAQLYAKNPATNTSANPYGKLGMGSSPNYFL